mmetsp:Transcript_99573/g.121790  ORF Transcript_99573/g.121790 Transcript_99573/m.121790 type:complete len:293 (+) Transcript_99573:75-953(+)
MSTKKQELGLIKNDDGNTKLLETNDETETLEDELANEIIELDKNDGWQNIHENFGDGGFRAAILGLSDGMISNLLLILGVQFALEEADNKPAYIIETGISGLVASTISMGIGEWIAMTNECEALKAEIEVERKHLDKYWDQESTTLRNIFRDHGISTETLNKMKRDLNNAPKDKVVDLHLKMKLGIDADDVGSPLKAGLFSAICTGSGAFVPISPYLMFGHDKGWIAAIILTSIIGISLGFITGKIAKINPFVTSIRQIAGIIIAVSLALLVNYFGVSQIPDDFKTLSYMWG